MLDLGTAQELLHGQLHRGDIVCEEEGINEYLNKEDLTLTAATFEATLVGMMRPLCLVVLTVMLEGKLGHLADKVVKKVGQIRTLFDENVTILAIGEIVMTQVGSTDDQ